MVMKKYAFTLCLFKYVATEDIVYVNDVFTWLVWKNKLYLRGSKSGKSEFVHGTVNYLSLPENEYLDMITALA